MNQFPAVENALEDIRQGKMVILFDDDQREQEGDLVIAADKITPEAINFMTKYARSFICLTLNDEMITRLQIPLMPERNKNLNQAAFMTSIEARFGVTTGASARDRAHTIQVAVNPESTYEDISMPGHVFPLRARAGGVLERAGHTEGSVDLARLAGLQPAAVIGEIMNEDGSMARLPDLYEFAKQHHLKLLTVNDLIAYRMAHEHVIEEWASAPLPTHLGDDFTIKVFRHRYDFTEHIALISQKMPKKGPCLVRIHSECLTGDTFGSTRCDCGWQLNNALEQIAAEGGVLLYMRQEGRGIGLGDKIKAYALQNQGFDTVEANHKLGFFADHRHYGLSAQILHHLGIKEIRLLTNNPRKVEDMERFNIKVTEILPLESQPTKDNKHYLKTKRDKLGHWLKEIKE